MSTNKLLELVAVQQKGLANSANADLVGKTVTVRGGTLSLDGQGLGAPMRFTLDGPASKVTVTVRDTSGRVVRTLDLGARPQGAVNTLWDGKDDAGNPQPAGAYTISVQAKNADGSTVPVTQETTGRVTSVSYEQGYATLVLDNGTSAPTSELLRIQSDAKPSGTK
jgi:flagellar basal-body rod modification protein FlgD